MLHHWSNGFCIDGWRLTFWKDLAHISFVLLLKWCTDWPLWVHRSWCSPCTCDSDQSFRCQRTSVNAALSSFVGHWLHVWQMWEVSPSSFAVSVLLLCLIFNYFWGQVDAMERSSGSLSDPSLQFIEGLLVNSPSPWSLHPQCPLSVMKSVVCFEYVGLSFNNSQQTQKILWGVPCGHVNGALHFFQVFLCQLFFVFFTENLNSFFFLVWFHFFPPFRNSQMQVILAFLCGTLGTCDWWCF